MKEQAALTVETAATRAIIALVEAIKAAKRKDFVNAFIAYGEALTYEFIYDSSQKDIEIHSLYHDRERYRILVLEWSTLLNEPDSIIEAAKLSAPIFRDKYTMHDF